MVTYHLFSNWNITQKANSFIVLNVLQMNKKVRKLQRAKECEEET